MKFFRSFLSISVLYCTVACAVNPNPPVWPANVFVFTSGTPTLTIQNQADAIYASNGGPVDNGQFVNTGYAMLFAPGTYTGLDINIGYYTSIMGLGASPDDTMINSVSCPQGNDDASIGALNTFWRSAENFATTPAEAWSPTSTVGMTWAVSQACPLRKVNVYGNLFLFQLNSSFASGFASGGFMADCKVTGSSNPTLSAIISGSQQQWFTRNTDMSVPSGVTNPPWSNGVWNQVFVGCNGAPASHCSNCPNGEIPPCACTNCTDSGCTVTCVGNPYTTVAATPLIAEKPYITSDSGATSFSLVVPQIEQNKIGTSQDNSTPVTTYDFTQVYVATESDTADTINAQINAGYHIILTPGTYNLTGSIQINTANTVVLGIGFPILISTTGQPCITVGPVNGVRVGGILLQAGPSTNPVTPTLLSWGSPGDDQVITSGFLYDCFARVGRFSGSASEPFNQTDLIVQINGSGVICDNLWLWRADHDSQGVVYNQNNACNTAMQINGDNVITYGMACEHTLQDLCQWNGDEGRCYFYQSEFPYDVTASYGTAGYAGYRVGSTVVNHQAYGVGVYSFFRDDLVTARSGIYVPTVGGMVFVNALTRFLNGNGGILSVINGNLGVNANNNTSAVNLSYPGPAYLCDYSNQCIQARIKHHRR